MLVTTIDMANGKDRFIRAGPFLGMCKELYGAELPIYGGLNYL